RGGGDVIVAALVEADRHDHLAVDEIVDRVDHRFAIDAIPAASTGEATLRADRCRRQVCDEVPLEAAVSRSVHADHIGAQEPPSEAAGGVDEVTNARLPIGPASPLGPPSPLIDASPRGSTSSKPTRPHAASHAIANHQPHTVLPGYDVRYSRSSASTYR